MVRTLTIEKGTPSRPDRCWRNRTGAPMVPRTTTAMPANTGAATTRPTDAATTSPTRFAVR